MSDESSLKYIEAVLQHIGADQDPEETTEWLDALAAIVRHAGAARAEYVVSSLLERARNLGLKVPSLARTPYVNTVPVHDEPAFPGDLKLEQELAAIMRWNALAMVVRANKAYGELGGHIASYASAADLFEVGFNHFFRGPQAAQGADLVFFQPHSAPGVYARAYLEGRLNEADLEHYRQEISAAKSGARGLSSYPHPWLMKDFWQFPTGSMGIGPITSIYQARFMRYLRDRGLARTDDRRVWGVFGDGEMDEPESIAALALAARERLDNLVWVINCNLQRLDGPVRGNGRIVDELELLFSGAGWRVIKLVWGSNWDDLFARDDNGSLKRALEALVDGQLQTLAAKDARYNREAFFGLDDDLRRLVAGMTDEQIEALSRGGHDLKKIYSAYALAQTRDGRPTVVLALTKKGYGMGLAGEARMTTHQQKKLDRDALLAFRDRFQLPINDEQAAALGYFRPDDDGEHMRYLRARRAALGGFLPTRRPDAPVVPVPDLASYADFAVNAAGKEMSTTMAFVRMLTALLKHKELGPRIVPIVADEARTFGMATLFKQIGIYSPVGQRYVPEDSGSLMSYREAVDGQILEEGISEAGALSSWVAAATSYSVHGLAMLPFYIYYSMFGFQRVGDLIWAAADQRARGFLLGATAGRTTLGGEGLQHQDGSSLLLASAVPNCKAYDPAFAGELAVIVHRGLQEMMVEQNDCFYYLTLMNESYANPTVDASNHADILRGLYRFAPAPDGLNPHIRLVGSGAILREVIAAAEMLWKNFGVAAEVWSATSFSELAREAMEVERWNRLNPGAQRRTSHVERSLTPTVPVVAASDYVRAWPNLIAGYVRSRYIALGTDGFGRSDTRENLRSYFEVDRNNIVLAAIQAIAEEGGSSSDLTLRCQQWLGDVSVGAPPWRH